MSKTELIDGIIITFVPIALLALLGLLYRERKSISRYFYKLRVKYLPIRFVMALAMSHDEESLSRGYYSEIKKTLLEELDSSGLSNIVTVKDFSNLISFVNKKEAEDFLIQKDIDLIVWGSFSNDSLRQNAEVISTLAPHFTYSYDHGEKNKNEIENFIATNIAQMLSLKNYWQIREHNSYADVAVISKNMLILTTFIIGLSFAFRGKLNLSEKIFERVYQKLVTQSDQTASILKQHLIKCYSVVAYKSLDSNDYTNTIDFSKKILSLDEQNHSALSILVLSEYKNGNIQESNNTIQKLRNFYPNSAITKMDGAFMDILNGKYKQALQKYKKVCQLQINKIDFSAQESMVMLFNEYEKSKEPAFMFASGMLALYLVGDVSLAKKDFATFLEKGSLQKHGVMYSEAQKLISQINAN